MTEQNKNFPEQGDIFSSEKNYGEETAKKADSTSFEVLLERLEEIVDKMEGGGLSLDESMKLYEEGIKKAEKLTAMLSDARNRVMKLVGNKNGGMTLEAFDEEELS